MSTLGALKHLGKKHGTPLFPFFRFALIIGAGLLMPTVSRAASNLVVIPTKLNANWESGSWDSGLTPLPELSFQNEPDTNLVTTTPDSNHYVEVSTNFARSGSYSLKVFGQPNARRSEIGFMDTAYRYNSGEGYYYAVSYCPDSSYSVASKFDTVITQWKPFSSGPSQSLKIVNDGTHRVYLKSNSITNDYYFDPLPLNEWTDFVFYFKWSLSSDGVTKIWRNGTLILDITGPTLVAGGQGYMKIGMYTCINQPRTMYFDNVRIGTNVVLNYSPVFIADPMSKAGAIATVAYSGTIAGSATDADSDVLTYSKVGGPAWLVVSTNGALSGMPGGADVGTNTFTIKVNDGRDGADVTVLNIVVTMSTAGPYMLTGSAGAGGTISPASTNVLAGGNQNFVIMASNYYRIATLTTNGTAVTGMSFDNNSTFTNFIWSNVQTSGVLAATFTSQVAANDTPYSWLAGYGLTNYNTDAAADQDGDGLTAWQEYLADTDPTNGTSRLAVTSLTIVTNQVCLTWTGGSSAWQYVEYCNSLTDTNDWKAVYTNIPPTTVTNTLFDAGARSVTSRFYRIKAWR